MGSEVIVFLNVRSPDFKKICFNTGFKTHTLQSELHIFRTGHRQLKFFFGNPHRLYFLKVKLVDLYRKFLVFRPRLLLNFCSKSQSQERDGTPSKQL
jgi:hypothetical protein